MPLPQFLTIQEDSSTLRSSDGFALRWVPGNSPHHAGNYFGVGKWTGAAWLAGEMICSSGDLNPHSNVADVISTIDGINWISTPTSSDINQQGCRVDVGCYAAGIHVIGGSNQINSGPFLLQSSPDGITWTYRNSSLNLWPTQSRCVAICYGLGKFFVAVEGVTPSVHHKVMSSPDGVTWTACTYAGNRIMSMAGSATEVVLGTANGFYRSTNGTSFAAVGGNGSYWFDKMVYANGMYVASGYAGAAVAQWSTDGGANWNDCVLNSDQYNTSNRKYNLAYGNGLFVMTGDPYTFTSTDGKTWRSVVVTTSLIVASEQASDGNYMFDLMNPGDWTSLPIRKTVLLELLDQAHYMVANYGPSNIWAILGKKILQNPLAVTDQFLWAVIGHPDIINYGGTPLAVQTAVGTVYDVFAV